MSDDRRDALRDALARVIAIRERAGVSQVELAAAIGIASSAISLYESGQRTPRGAIREAYVDALRVLRDAGAGTTG